MRNMCYRDTFIRVAADCPAGAGIAPVGKLDRRPVHVLQYELLAGSPYRYTHDDLRFEVHIRHQQIPDDQVASRGAAIRAELLDRPHPCLRASLLPKKYGWGVHYDGLGRIALYGIDSPEYYRFTEPGAVGTLLSAIRSRRALS